MRSTYLRNSVLFFILIFALAGTAFCQTPAVDIVVTVSDGAGGTQSLRFGLDPAATDGIDASLGETELPPLPPSGVFDARFVGDDIGLSLGQGLLKDYRQGSATTAGLRVHEINYQVGAGTSIVVSWYLPSGVTGRLQDVILGTLIDQAMSGSGSYTVTNPASFSKLMMTITYALGGGGTPPTVTTGAASSVSSTGAQANGTVNPNGVSTTYYFEYGTTTSYGTQTSSVSAGSGTSETSVNATLSGLIPATLYHYRVVATNSAGTSLGSDEAFTTTVLAPTVVTLAATNVAGTSALLNGTVNPHGVAATYYFEFGTTPDYGSQTNVGSAGSATSETSVSAPLIGLTPATEYHYRVVATNSAGLSQGSDMTFIAIPAGIVADGVLPASYGLCQNYPNPFNPSTRIQYQLPKVSRVLLKVLNTFGQVVATLEVGLREAGTHVVEWVPALPSGVYFYRLEAGEFEETKRMILLK